MKPPNHEKQVICEHTALFSDNSTPRKSKAFLSFSTARMCLQCDAIHQAGSCPRCGHPEWMPLSRVLGCDCLKLRLTSSD